MRYFIYLLLTVIIIILPSVWVIATTVLIRISKYISRRLESTTFANDPSDYRVRMAQTREHESFVKSSVFSLVPFFMGVVCGAFLIDRDTGVVRWEVILGGVFVCVIAMGIIGLFSIREGRSVRFVSDMYWSVQSGEININNMTIGYRKIILDDLEKSIAENATLEVLGKHITYQDMKNYVCQDEIRKRIKNEKNIELDTYKRIIIIAYILLCSLYNIFLIFLYGSVEGLSVVLKSIIIFTALSVSIFFCYIYYNYLTLRLEYYSGNYAETKSSNVLTVIKQFNWLRNEISP